MRSASLVFPIVIGWESIDFPVRLVKSLRETEETVSERLPYEHDLIEQAMTTPIEIVSKDHDPKLDYSRAVCEAFIRNFALEV